MFLWQEKEDKNVEGNLFEEDSEQNKEHWVAYKMLRYETDHTYYWSYITNQTVKFRQTITDYFCQVTINGF